jgi:hypothetical protein
MTMTKYYISCRVATGQVSVNDRTIISAPPIWYRFIGQDISNLIRWLDRFGDVIIEEM